MDELQIPGHPAKDVSNMARLGRQSHVHLGVLELKLDISSFLACGGVARKKVEREWMISMVDVFPDEGGPQRWEEGLLTPILEVYRCLYDRRKGVVDVFGNMKSTDEWEPWMAHDNGMAEGICSNWAPVDL